MARPLIIAVAGKGGEGKTLVSVNLACALAREGARVLYLDLDTGMGLTNPNWGFEIRHGLDDFWDRGELTALTEKVSSGGPGDKSAATLEVLGGHAEYLPEKADPHRLGDALGKGGWTHIVMDLGAGTKRQVFRFCALADQLLLVSGDHPNAIRETVDITGTALGIRSDLRFTLLLNRVPEERMEAAVESFGRTMAEKFVSVQIGDRSEQGNLGRFVRSDRGNWEVRETALPSFGQFLPGSKRLVPGSRDMVWFLELARTMTRPKGVGGLDLGALLARVFRKRGGGTREPMKRDAAVAPLHDLFKRLEQRQELMQAMGRIGVFASAKGGVGQTETVARLAALGNPGMSQLVFDLNMEETSRHSSLGWYFGMRTPVAVKTLWEKEGHLWPLDRKKKIDLFFYRNRMGIESGASFLEALCERVTEQMGGPRERRGWMDGESGVETPVMLLGLLSGRMAVLSDARDLESEWKLIHWVREWHRAKETFSKPGARLSILLTHGPRESATESRKRRERLAGAIGEPAAPGIESIYLFPEHRPMDGSWAGQILGPEEKRFLKEFFAEPKAGAGKKTAGVARSRR